MVEITADGLTELPDLPEATKSTENVIKTLPGQAQTQPSAQQPAPKKPQRKEVSEITAEGLEELPDAPIEPQKLLDAPKFDKLPSIFPVLTQPKEDDISADTLRALLEAPVDPERRKRADVAPSEEKKPEEKKPEEKKPTFNYTPLPDINARKKQVSAKVELSEEEKEKLEAQRAKLAALEAKMKADEDGALHLFTHYFFPECTPIRSLLFIASLIH